MKKALLFGVSLALTASPAAAAYWQLLGSTDTGSIFYIDAATIQNDGNIVTYWIKIAARNDRTKDFREAKQQVSINCSERTITTIDSTFYAPSGRVLESDTVPLILRKAEPIAPDTIAETELTYVCKG